MVTRKCGVARGMTLIELMMSVIAALILIVGVSAMLYRGHNGYWTMFRRVNSDVVRNAYEARRIFDRIVRQATMDAEYPDQADGANMIYVYYYSDPTDISDLLSKTPRLPDKFAGFYRQGTSLILKRGDVPAGTTSLSSLNPTALAGTETTIASNVVSCLFTVRGTSVGMVLTLDNQTNPPPGVSIIETLKMTVTTSAVRHNH